MKEQLIKFDTGPNIEKNKKKYNRITKDKLINIKT